MSNWSPKPLRPTEQNPIFQMDDDAGYVVKSQTNIQRQRTLDGTPHTSMRASALEAPGIALYLDEGLVKGEAAGTTSVKTDPPLNPDEVVKAFMGKDEDAEDSKKGTIGEGVASAVSGAAKVVGNTASGTVQSTNRLK